MGPGPGDRWWRQRWRGETYHWGLARVIGGGGSERRRSRRRWMSGGGKGEPISGAWHGDRCDGDGAEPISGAWPE